MCTRAVYLGPDDIVVTGRNMDWPTDMGTNMYAFPRGIERDGAAGPDSITWTSRYGSVVTGAFDITTPDGMNEKGLVSNLLYLAEADYPKPQPGDKRKLMSLSLWNQYVLDNFATVEEAVAGLTEEEFIPIPLWTPDGQPGLVHLSVSDPTGDSAIFEYVGGALQVHHGRQYQVMTNSPVFDQQLAISAYWNEIGGMTMLPGTSRAADRFVRASFYLTKVPTVADNREAIAVIFSIMRNASAPFGIVAPEEPYVSSTWWRTVADQRDRVYYFESVLSPNLFWVELDDIDFSAGGPARKLTLTGRPIYSGNMAAHFEPCGPFNFMPVEV